jgi:rhamnose transport system permease protein
VGFVVKQNPEMSILWTVLLGMALGAVLGSFNGLIISFGKVPPIIATLGTLSVYRGLIFFYSQGTWVNSQSKNYLFSVSTQRIACRVGRCFMGFAL